MVGVDDILYHLGDFAFGSYGQIINYRQRIKCKHIILILGNHDRIIFQNKHRLYNIFDDIVKFITISIASKIYLLNHYPIGEERDIEKVKAFQRYMDMGVIALHGHKHSQLPSDVGVDAHNFKPIKLG
jgi:calcineurin-like phosphoesterase family protein